VSVEDGLEFGWKFAMTSSSIEFRWPILGFICLLELLVCIVLFDVWVGACREFLLWCG